MASRHYRFYYLDRIGAIRRAVDHACADDRDALAHAGQLLGGYAGIEVWQSDRRIGSVQQPSAVPAGPPAMPDFAACREA